MKPRVFIGSSAEGLRVANAVQQNLDHDADCTVWTQGVFGVSSLTVDALANAVQNNDFGIFVFSPDDAIQIREHRVMAARDNVILESGLFMGRYGRDRNFIVGPRELRDFHIPTDLLGITLAEYDPTRLATNAQAAVGTACTSILNAIQSHPVMTTKLTFALSVDRDGTNFPLRLGVNIRNTTGLSVLVTSRYFEMGTALRPHVNAKGNPSQNQYEIKFAAPGSNTLNQFQVLIPPTQSTSTWMPLDPTHTDTEVRSTIDSAGCGKWNYTCDWLGPNGWHREYMEKM
jgi:hypothetical protein